MMGAADEREKHRADDGLLDEAATALQTVADIDECGDGFHIDERDVLSPHMNDCHECQMVIRARNVLTRIRERKAGK
jgi:hypothetical protein